MIENISQKCIIDKLKKFYTNGIVSSEKWEEVVQREGDYFLASIIGEIQILLFTVGK